MIGELIPTAYTYDQGRVELNDSFSGTANLNNLLLDADFSGGTGGGVIYSAGTDLYNIFLTSAGANDITRVQPGLNTYTGGTGNYPNINISGGTFNNLNITGGTLSSGGTDLYSIFLTSAGANDITRVQPGLNTYTGGTGNEPTVNISAATLTYLSASTISGGTIFSGTSNISNLFVSNISEGSNISVAGAPTNRVISLNGNININNISFSGTGTGNIFSATTISGGTIYSGSTNLYDIFCTDCGTGFSGFSSSTGAFSIIENNGSTNIASESYSYAGGRDASSNNFGEWSRTSGSLGQNGIVSWYGTTTLAPSNISQIYLDGGSLSKRFVVPLDSSYFFDITATARVIGGPADGESAAWNAQGMIKNIGGVVSLATDTLYGSPFFMIQKAGDTSFASSTCIVSAETSTSALTVTVVGPDDNVDWFVKGEYVKVK